MNVQEAPLQVTQESIDNNYYIAPKPLAEGQYEEEKKAIESILEGVQISNFYVDESTDEYLGGDFVFANLQVEGYQAARVGIQVSVNTVFIEAFDGDETVFFDTVEELINT